MSPRRDSILDSGHWEKNKSDLNLAARADEGRLLSPRSQTNGVTSGPPSRESWPSWLFHLLQPSIFARSSGQPTQVRGTAYLDGLRGFAAFLVYLGHHESWTHEGNLRGIILENAFGYGRNYYFACLPGIRAFFSGGHMAVCVFFVISGYVLSAKPLTLIHAGEYVKLGDNLASALFRRWIRLFIPVFGTTFIFMTSWHAFGLWTNSPPHQETYREELWNWYVELKKFSYIFNLGGDPWLTYNFHVWSIPTEFRGSIIVYTALLAFSRCRRNARLICEFGLIFYFMYIVDGWFCSLFSVGILLCDLDLLAKADQLPDIFNRLKPWKHVIFNNMFVIGVYLGGVPHTNRDIKILRTSPGWYYLSFLKPQAFFDYKWFYLFWSATFIVVSSGHLSWLKKFFELPFNQYMGRISYAFYLVHGPVLWLLGDRLYSAVGWVRREHLEGIPQWINIFPLSKAGPFGLELSFIAVHFVVFPVTLWTAEIATKVFDEPAVKFASWAYKLTLASAS